MTPEQVYRAALEIYGDPVEARIAAAQAQLETGGGASMPGNNLFGIKGPGGTYSTTEVVDGQPVRTQASFRVYPDPRASIVDRLKFLRNNPRYARAGYFDATTPEEKAEALQRAGYATDPNYAAKLKQIMSGGVTTMPTSAFPQFSPAAAAAMTMPTSGMAPIAGVLGTALAGPLLGQTQPRSLLDMFAPGSGFGYDLAVGIAATPGGPMTAIAGGMANAKDKAFERQMLAAKGKTIGMPSATQEVLNLMAMGVPQDQALRMKYPSGTTRGTKLVTEGGVTYEEYVRPDGTFGYRELTPEQAASRLGILETESGAKSRGTTEAAERVKMRRDMVNEYNAGVRTIPSQLQRYQSLLNEFESGRFQTGKFDQYRRVFDEEIQALDYESAVALLERYKTLGMGVLSDSDIALLRDTVPSADKKREVNMRILNRLVGSLREQYQYLQQLRGVLSQPGFDPLNWIPPLQEIAPLDQPSLRRGTSVPSGAPGPAGFDAEFDAMMREATQ